MSADPPDWSGTPNATRLPSILVSHMGMIAHVSLNPSMQGLLAYYKERAIRTSRSDAQLRAIAIARRLCRQASTMLSIMASRRALGLAGRLAMRSD
ncbi:hypothetical protein PYCCODRAFT_648469 [Trametes coccinea BRFM310]|uniref:Uncharacterized protein n=1 Tax=Trametes coccinea (strain BRFM310) TaxID=1353009 RepID=A0A1Y2IIF8_TRAC3|nr:hypothetical protein PYCCODRAFT_648469 [Trametes coccinea BRFM310]